MEGDAGDVEQRLASALADKYDVVRLLGEGGMAFDGAIKITLMVLRSQIHFAFRAWDSTLVLA